MATNNSIDAPLPLASTKGGTGTASPTAHTLPVANGASAFTFQGPMTNGQLQIGNTGNAPTLGTITAGTGISVSNGAGTITLSTTGAAALLPLVTVTTLSVSMTANTEYFVNVTGGGGPGAIPVLTLPAGGTIGDIIRITTTSSAFPNGCTVGQLASQQINYLEYGTTVGTGGSVQISGNSFLELWYQGSNIWNIRIATLGGIGSNNTSNALGNLIVT